MPSFKIIGILVLEKNFFYIFAIYSQGGNLGHVTLTIYINFDQTVSEKIFEYYGNIHVYCPGVGADQPLGSIFFFFFQNHKSSVHLPISIKIFLSNDILTIFPIQMHGRPTLTLP